MNGTKNRLLWSMALLGLFLVCTGTACMNKVIEGPAPGVRVDDPRAPYATVRMNTVAILDPSVSWWHGKESKRYSAVAVERTSSRRNETGTLEVWATLRNRSTTPLQLQARTHFFDATEYPVEGPSAWRRIHLPSNGVAHYREHSTRIHDVANYYVEIQEAR